MNQARCVLLGTLVLSLAAALPGCGGGGGAPGDAVPASPAPWALRATDAAALTAYFQAALGPSSASYATTAAGGTAAPAPASAAAFSDTTLQEAGVDEDDLVKSDGRFVWSLDRDTSASLRTTLRRQQLDAAAADAALAPVDSLALPFSANVNGSGLYLDSDRQQVVALGQGGGGVFALGVATPMAAWFAPWSWQGATDAVFVSTPASGAMQVTRRLHITASLVGSRRVGSTLYLVLRSYPALAGFDPSWTPARADANKALLAALQPQQVLPAISVDGGAAQPLVDAASCLVQDQLAAKTADIISVVGIDLATGNRGARCFMGQTEAFYMSPANLYLATTRFAYGSSGATPVYQSQASTDIHKFALDALAISYRGSGNVAGHLGFDQGRKSFRFGEYQDTLRVVTQTQTQAIPIALPPVGVPTGGTGTVGGTGAATGGASGTGATAAAAPSPAQLTILREQGGALVAVGQLPNASRPEPIGKPGELLYASRFLGERAYIVTYRLTDPLYVLDLSNPADPKVAGQLQVSGYSDFLFPLGDTLLLGVGKDAVSDGAAGDDGRFAWYQGVQVSLIDVSDPAHPAEVARQVIGRRGSTATALSDHHGIAIQASAGSARISLPVDVHETPPAAPTGAPSEYFQYTRTELQRFQVDLGSGQLAQLPAIATNRTDTFERSLVWDRSLIWGSQVHWDQDGVWRSAPW